MAGRTARAKHNPTKRSNTLKQFVSKLRMNCLSVLDHFLGLALKGLTLQMLLTLQHLTYQRRLTGLL